jgi:hypothetical protein
MGFKNILDPGIAFCRALEIWIYFAKRIKNGGFAIAFEIIGSMCQTAGINLFDFHEWKNLNVDGLRNLFNRSLIDGTKVNPLSAGLP